MKNMVPLDGGVLFPTGTKRQHKTKEKKTQELKTAEGQRTRVEVSLGPVGKGEGKPEEAAQVNGHNAHQKEKLAPGEIQPRVQLPLASTGAEFGGWGDG